MKIQVDTGHGQGTTTGLAVAPELFDFQADSIAEVVVDGVGPAHRPPTNCGWPKAGSKTAAP